MRKNSLLNGSAIMVAAALAACSGDAPTTSAETEVAAPPVETEGLIEIRNVGIVEMEPVGAPACLWITLAKDPPRLPLGPEQRRVAGCTVPEIRLYPSKLALALRVEAALDMFGLDR